ncbi:hypothetical protein IMSAG025_01210 [Muribaculaceae bacterium]|nr:hypothetical protein IMSAG025_01210 [Muribaculaceae bacterium]
MRSEAVFSMNEQTSAPSLSEMHVAGGVYLGFAAVVEITVYGKRGFCLRLAHLHVNLAAYRFISVLYGAGTLGYGNRLHPWSGDVSETKR